MEAVESVSLPAIDSAKIRSEFPALNREIRPGVPLVYLDTTATSQKPLHVLDAMERYYRLHNAKLQSVGSNCNGCGKTCG